MKKNSDLVFACQAGKKTQAFQTASQEIPVDTIILYRGWFLVRERAPQESEKQNKEKGAQKSANCHSTHDVWVTDKEIWGASDMTGSSNVQGRGGLNQGPARRTPLSGRECVPEAKRLISSSCHNGFPVRTDREVQDTEGVPGQRGQGFHGWVTAKRHPGSMLYPVVIAQQHRCPLHRRK